MKVCRNRREKAGGDRGGVYRGRGVGKRGLSRSEAKEREWRDS